MVSGTRVGRRQRVQLTLTPRCWAMLGELAARAGLSRSGVVEGLVRERAAADASEGLPEGKEGAP